MDTIYYTLNTRRVKVSGGADLVSIVPVAQPREQAPARKAGEVLDLERCRRRLETKNAWKTLTQAADEMEETQEASEEVSPVLPRSRRERAASWLELGASAAVTLTGLSAAALLLSLL